MKSIHLFLDVFVLVVLALIHLLQARREFVMSRCHTRIVGARSGCDNFNFFIYLLTILFVSVVSFWRFRFARFARFVSLVSVVSFRPFRFVVSGFSTCQIYRDSGCFPLCQDQWEYLRLNWANQ